MPPNPSKNAHIIMFRDIALNGILEIADTPFVSSIIPEKSPVAKLDGMFKLFSIGETIISKISKTLVLLSIEIITLNSITKPPIITTVLIELIILL